MHDYFVIGMVEAGVQKFDYRRDQHITLPTGSIVLNPGEPHTGESAIPSGFRYRALYPEAYVLQQVASEIQGRSQQIPFFSQPVIHDSVLFEHMRNLHATLETATSTLEHESRYLWTLAQLVIRHADSRFHASALKSERSEIRKIRAHIEERYAEDIKLADLATLVHWSPFYLLRAFRKEVGIPPHAYLESIRVRRAQDLLKNGLPIAEAAYATGFSSQSHLTTTFKRFIGVTPGQYAKEVNFLKDIHRLSELS